ncbi:HlyD family efflux transporter periplasmic adaptor subunit [Alkaliphilus transvaalensis]|uniref:HlyD family efflux transporter periplasmic adaptor subunit n=1 Tax=Alkaliphilus transvaalensis TaxID=114628 RepID=UPI00047ACCA4|nr:HlyD family efflux transporter periplasmic adaptor subunit [Alkaliphilus transvaalensis]
MKTKVKKKKKRLIKKGFGKFAIILIICLYFLSRVFPILGTNSQKTVVAEFGVIENSFSVTGYIARDEKVFAKPSQGEIKFFVSEGEKVAKGQKLAEIYSENLDEKYVQDLEIINHRIQNIESNQAEKSLFDRDLNKIDSEVNTILAKMQQDINKGDYSNISNYKKTLDELADKKNIISGSNSFGGRSLAQLEEEKKIIESKLQSSLQVIHSDYPGFIAFGQDGLEGLFNLTTIESIGVGDLETLNNSKTQQSDQQEENTVLRIINSHRWSIVAEVDTQQIEMFSEGRRIRIRRQGEERQYSALLRKIVTDGERSVIILDINEVMEGFYQDRTVMIDIIQERYEGIMVPNTTIDELDGRKGVYRVDVNGFVRFIPVKVRGSNREYAILHEQTFEEVIDNERVTVSTIKLYDELVSNGSKVSEGQRVK